MKASKISMIFLLIAAFITGSIDVQAASVSLNMTSYELYEGQTLDVNVTVDPEDVSIAGVQIDVFFDGNTLETMAIKEGNLLNQNGANTFFSDLAPGDNSISNIVGAILENSSVMDPAIFATITFKAKNAGTSFIELRNVKISKPSGDLLDVNISGRTSINIISDTNDNGNSGSNGVSNAGGGGGGGGAGGMSGENYSNIETKEKYDRSINKDLSTSYVFKNSGPIIYVNITGNINAGEINTAVEVLRNTSSLVKYQAPDTVYKNINIWVGTFGYATPTNIKHAEITFRVPVSWLISNSIDPDSITMMHYQGAWEKLPTEKISETSEWIYYEASTMRFSPHAIIGKRTYGGSYNWIPQTAANTESTGNTGAQQTEKQESNVGNEAESPGNLNKYLIIGIFICIALNATLIIRFRKTKKIMF